MRVVRRYWVAEGTMARWHEDVAQFQPRGQGLKRCSYCSTRWWLEDGYWRMITERLIQYPDGKGV